MQKLVWTKMEGIQVATDLPGIWRLAQCENGRARLSLTIGDEEVETVSREYADEATAKSIAQELSEALSHYRVGRIEFSDTDPMHRNYWSFRIHCAGQSECLEAVYDPFAARWLEAALV